MWRVGVVSGANIRIRDVAKSIIIEKLLLRWWLITVILAWWTGGIRIKTYIKIGEISDVRWRQFDENL